MQSKVSRRQLIAAGAVGAAVAATTSAAQAASKKPQFDKVYDVIVVGSGFAGLAAALESRLGGAEVLLIEKMPAFGGNSAINGGAFSVAGSPLQKKFGIKDSPEQMLADMIRSGRGLSHVDLLKMVVEGSLPAYEFTLRHGVKYKDFVQHFGGHSVPRTLQTVESTGGGITRPLTESCRKHGVELHLRAKMEEFIRDDDGRVVGLVVRERYLFPNEESGVLQRYGARKGVIMATGGFSRNIWFRRQQDPNLDERLDSTNHPGATGEGMLKMFAIGAAPVQVDQIQLGPWSSPDERGFGLVSQFNTIAGFPMGIMVDVRNGRRFCNELADRKERTDAILGLMDNGKPVYPVCFTDSKGVEKAHSGQAVPGTGGSVELHGEEQEGHAVQACARFGHRFGSSSVLRLPRLAQGALLHGWRRHHGQGPGTRRDGQDHSGAVCLRRSDRRYARCEPFGRLRDCRRPGDGTRGC